MTYDHGLTRQRFIAAAAVWVLLASALMPMVRSARLNDRISCCRNESSCPMHQKDAGESRLDRCPADANDSAVNVISVRAVLTSIVLPQPADGDLRFFPGADANAGDWLTPPPIPPPRLV